MFNILLSLVSTIPDKSKSPNLKLPLVVNCPSSKLGLLKVKLSKLKLPDVTDCSPSVLIFLFKVKPSIGLNSQPCLFFY